MHFFFRLFRPFFVNIYTSYIKKASCLLFNLKSRTKSLYRSNHVIKFSPLTCMHYTIVCISSWSLSAGATSSKASAHIGPPPALRHAWQHTWQCKQPNHKSVRAWMKATMTRKPMNLWMEKDVGRTWLWRHVCKQTLWQRLMCTVY